jgi:hypothetical protein
MLPSKEYLNAIASKLERLNPGIEQAVVLRKEELKASSGILNSIGNAGKAYLDSTNQVVSKPDPLFADRNTY